jgi:DNA-directed RNA polymerase specialized sigma24 family protein
VSDSTPERKREQDTDLLLQKVQEGDESALEVLYARYIRRLEAWAHGRVPDRARDDHDTYVVAHDVLVRCLLWAMVSGQQIDVAFQAVARRALQNRLKDLARRRPRVHVELDDSMPQIGASALDQILARELEDFAMGAVRNLSAEEQRLLFLRFDLELPFEEIARDLELDSADAARMRTNRLLRRLAAVLTSAEA